MDLGPPGFHHQFPVRLLIIRRPNLPHLVSAQTLDRQGRWTASTGDFGPQFTWEKLPRSRDRTGCKRRPENTPTGLRRFPSQPCGFPPERCTKLAELPSLVCAIRLGCCLRTCNRFSPACQGASRASELCSLKWRLDSVSPEEWSIRSRVAMLGE